MRQQTAEANPGGAQFGPTPAYSPAKAKAQVLRRLLAGFVVIIALLGLDGFVGFFGSKSVRDVLSTLSRQEADSLANMAGFRQAQWKLLAIEYQLLAREADASTQDAEKALTDLTRSLRKLFARVSPGDPDIELWQALQHNSFAEIAAVRRQLSHVTGKDLDLAQLLATNELVTVTTEKLGQANDARTEATRRWIEDATRRQSIEDAVLLAACLLVSCLFLWTSTRIYYRMSQQSEELNQISWQLLEKQEMLAQRLSRELHDELGQSLTALKTNFSRHAAAGCADPSWMKDCNDLLKGSIRGAHEISQLLRPTLLDDFGLDSALSWLCERFEERNGIRVRYQSDYHWRLDEQAETHVFRIAQEALTNVSRHAEATFVEVLFSKQYGLVRLTIRDNGVGLKPRPRNTLPSLGLTGMKARARSLEGEMRVESSPGHGVTIQVIFPAKIAS